ncbi:MAG: SGNH/GDSL hydrolase family protein [Acidobacteriota bacterium]
MKRGAGNLLAAVLAAVLTLLGLEAATRLLWTSAPLVGGEGEPLPLEKVPDRRVIYRLVPGSSGRYNGTSVTINSRGLRDREYAETPPEGMTRILVLGDSMVFGIGLSPERTLPAQLARALAPAEAINAGVFGYNLDQEISLLADVGLDYRPDVVVACFVHNDIDNWGLGDAGAVPRITSSRFDPPPPGAWSDRMADLLLPAPFDPDRLNLLPGRARGGRAGRAGPSRLYRLAYRRLRTDAWNLTEGERPDPFVENPSCQAEQVIWQPLGRRYARMREMVRGAGARLAVVIQGGQLWEGRPLRRLMRILRTEAIPFLDLTPVWRDPAYYARRYSLGWDPHPNARANRIAASLVADFLERSGMISRGAARGDRDVGPRDVIADGPELRPVLAQWRKRQSSRIREGERAWRDETARFTAALDLFGSDLEHHADQVLYGFWRRREGEPPPAPLARARGLWMAERGAVLLRRSARTAQVVIDLVVPAAPGASGRGPTALTVALGAFPDDCEAFTRSFPLESGDAGGRLRLRTRIPEALRATGTLEVGLRVDRCLRAGRLGRPAPATTHGWFRCSSSASRSKPGDDHSHPAEKHAPRGFHGDPGLTLKGVLT